MTCIITYKSKISLHSHYNLCAHFWDGAGGALVTILTDYYVTRLPRIMYNLLFRPNERYCDFLRISKLDQELIL